MAAEKIQATDQIGQLAPLFTYLQNLGGSKGTSTSSGSSTSSIDPKFLEGLQQILGTQMGQTTPEGAAAMLQEVFRVGGKGAPQLANQLANAVGARTGSNSALAIGNSNLQAELAGQATKLLSGLQVNAGTTANQLAQAAPKTETKTATTTEKKGGDNKMLQLLPFLLGQGKNLKNLYEGGKGLADKFSGAGNSGGGGSAWMNGVAGTSMDNTFIGNASTGAESIFSNNTGGFDAFDTGAFDTGVGNAFDFGSVVDAGVDFGGAAAGFDYGAFGDSFDAFDTFGALDAGSDFIDLGAFFADGGLVKKKKVGKSVGMKAMSKAPGYAGGGRVTQLASAQEQPDRTDAINYLPQEDSPRSQVAQPQAPNSRPDFSNEQLPEDVLTFFRGEGARGRKDITGSDGKYYLGTADEMYTANSGAQGEAGGGIANDWANTGVIQAVSMDPNTRRNSLYNKTFNIDDGSFRDISVINQQKEKSAIADFASWAVSAVGLATGNPWLALAQAGGKTALGEALSPDGRNIKPHIFGGKNNARVAQAAVYDPNDRGNQYAGGGEISGKGTGTSDSIPIRVSDGEYIISNDVVEMLGVDFFDNLQAMFHQPTAAQK